jgi:hypothetical protein
MYQNVSVCGGPVSAPPSPGPSFTSQMSQTSNTVIPSCSHGTVSLSSIGTYYTGVSDTSPTPVSNRFFAPENVAYLQDQLQILLTRLVGEPVRVPINEEFAQSMYDIASRNSGLGFLGDDGLRQLNEMFVESEGRIQYLSIRQGKLQEQLFIKEDRILTFPYPEPTKCVKGELQIDTSGYMLSSPWGNNFGNYLNDVLQIGPFANGKCKAVDNSNPFSQPIRT